MSDKLYHNMRTSILNMIEATETLRDSLYVMRGVQDEAEIDAQVEMYDNMIEKLKKENEKYFMLEMETMKHNVEVYSEEFRCPVTVKMTFDEMERDLCIRADCGLSMKSMCPDDHDAWYMDNWNPTIVYMFEECLLGSYFKDYMKLKFNVVNEEYESESDSDI